MAETHRLKKYQTGMLNGSGDISDFRSIRYNGIRVDGVSPAENMTCSFRIPSFHG